MADREGQPPAGVQLQLRQEAGFGCCRCGYPFYQYHHIIPWEIEHHYRPEDMMIVCPNCHNEIRAGNVSEAEQRKWKNKPANIQAGFADGLLRIDQNELAVQLGGAIFTETPILVRMYGENIISAKLSENGRLLISMRSYDQNENIVFDVRDNQWITGADLPWDLYAKWRHVKLRSEPRKIELEVDARQSPVKVRGTFWKKGDWFEATENIMQSAGMGIIGAISVSHCSVGFSIQ